MRHLILYVLLVCAPSALAADFYLSPTGDDTTGDGTIGTPWLTLEHLDTKIDDATVGCSDTVHLRGGTYTDTDDGLRVAKACTLGTELTIRNYAGETPVFESDGRDWGGPSSLLYLAGGKYIVFQGIEHRPAGTSGQSRSVHIDGNSHNNTFADYTAVGGVLAGGGYSFITNVVRIDGDYNEFSGCHIEGTGDPTDLPSLPSGSGLNIISSSAFNEIHGCTFVNNCHDHVTVAGDYNKIYDNTMEDYGYGVNVTAGASYNLIERNVMKDIYKTPRGLGHGYGKNCLFLSGDHNSIRQNICHNSYAEGVVIYGYNAPNEFEENLIYNNVVYSTRSRGWRIAPLGANNVFSNTLVNNVLMGANYDGVFDLESIKIQGVTDATEDTETNEVAYNLMIAVVSEVFQDDYSDFVDSDFTTPDAHSVSWYETNRTTWHDNIYNHTGNEPLFVSPSGGNFAVETGSSLIDAGVVVSDTNGAYVETNYTGYGWGNLIYTGSAPDIGAEEFNDDLSVPATSGVTSSGVAFR